MSSNKVLDQVKGYKEWLLANKKGFTVTVAGSVVVVSIVGGVFGIVPLNNAKNTAQTEYDKIMTKYRTSLGVNTDLEQQIATLKGTISDLVDERDGLQLQLQQAEQPEEPTEEEIIEEAEEEEQETIDYYIPTLEDEQALESARQYLQIGGFSRQRMREQLQYEGFNSTAIEYALDSLY